MVWARGVSTASKTCVHKAFISVLIVPSESFLISHYCKILRHSHFNTAKYSDVSCQFCYVITDHLIAKVDDLIKYLFSSLNSSLEFQSCFVHFENNGEKLISFASISALIDLRLPLCDFEVQVHLYFVQYLK